MLVLHVVLHGWINLVSYVCCWHAAALSCSDLQGYGKPTRADIYVKGPG